MAAPPGYDHLHVTAYCWKWLTPQLMISLFPHRVLHILKGSLAACMMQGLATLL